MIGSSLDNFFYYWLVANAREMQTFTFRAFRASKLTKAIYALYSHAQLPGAGLLDREGWPEARACRGRALPRPRSGLNTADSRPPRPVYYGNSRMVRPKFLKIRARFAQDSYEIRTKFELIRTGFVPDSYQIRIEFEQDSGKFA